MVFVWKYAFLQNLACCWKWRYKERNIILLNFKEISCSTWAFLNVFLLHLPTLSLYVEEALHVNSLTLIMFSTLSAPNVVVLRDINFSIFSPSPYFSVGHSSWFSYCHHLAVHFYFVTSATIKMLDNSSYCTLVVATKDNLNCFWNKFKAILRM